MKNNQVFFNDNEFQEFTGIDLDSLVQSKLNDLAEQVSYLYSQGYDDLAELLRAEGLQLAQSADNEDLFVYLTDFALS